MKNFNVVANIQEGVGNLEGKLLAVITAGSFPSPSQDGKILIFSGSDAEKLGSFLGKNVFIQGVLSPWEGRDGDMLFGVSLVSVSQISVMEVLEAQKLLGAPKGVFVDVNATSKGKAGMSTASLLNKD